MSNKTKLEIGQYVYHRDIYDHKEKLKVVGIREEEIELEGDYSGGTHMVCQKQWMPISGVSRIFNHKYKEECRKTATSIQALAIPVNENHNNMTKTMFELLHMVFVLTNDVSLNPEF